MISAFSSCGGASAFRAQARLRRRTNGTIRFMARRIAPWFRFPVNMRPTDVAEVATFPAAATERAEMSTPWSEERRLLEAIRAGDRAAAEEMVERTYSAVFASLFRLCGDSDRAADLTQETYQKAWAALPGFDGRSPLFTWLYT